MFNKAIAVINSKKITVSRVWFLLFPLAVSLIALTFGGVLLVSARETVVDTITVCIDGPPLCDYDSIQAGIDAASNGDAVLVSSGTYTENLALKSGILLSSTDGATTTIVTSDNGPIVSAISVYSTTMRGFTIRGRGQMSSAVGMIVFNSHLNIAHSVIEDLSGLDNLSSGTGSPDAIGILAAGSGILSLNHVTIHELSGGDQDCWPTICSAPGDAIGISAAGSLSLAITDSTLTTLRGGVEKAFYYFSDGVGGEAVGIESWDRVSITLQQSIITGLIGGGYYGIEYCPHVARAAPVIGLRMTGGNLWAKSNFIGEFISIDAGRGVLGDINAFQLSHMSRAHINYNVIENLFHINSSESVNHEEPIRAPCPMGGYEVDGIEVTQFGYLEVLGNSLTGLYQRSNSTCGHTFGIWVKNNDSLTKIQDNSIESLRGPSHCLWNDLPLSSAAIIVQASRMSMIDSNEINSIQGGAGTVECCPTYYDGGNAAGIWVSDTDMGTIQNNIVASIFGGWSPTDTSGEAYGMYVDESLVDIFNNTFLKTSGGMASGGIQAESFGVLLTGTSFVNLVNNIVADHKVGVLVDQPGTVFLDYQGLWNNDTNYVGTYGGPHDVIADPGFVDVSVDDLHLRADSSYIDSGTNDGSPDSDFDDEPRPVDGNHDGLMITDIGADEYWHGLRGSYKSSAYPAIEPGGFIDYSIVISNPSVIHHLWNVSVYDSLPQFTTYVTGTLAATGGSVQVTDNVLFWWGEVAPSTSVTITFQVQVDLAVESPYAIVNLAQLDDGIGQPITLHSLVFVDPLLMHLPLIK